MQIACGARGARWLRAGMAMAAWWLGACAERHPVEPPVASPRAVAFLVLSDSAPAAGDIVRVEVRLRAGIDVGSVGSFAATLRYDGAALAAAEEAPLADAVLRAVNATEVGVVRAAGATAEGFGDSPLFAVTFRVTRPDGVRTMRLGFAELNGVGRADLRRTLTIAPGTASEPRP